MTAKRPYRAEDFLSIHTVSDPRISPDGSRVAYVVGEADREADEFRSHIWVAPLDGSCPPRQLTRGAQKDSQPRWSPDGTTLAFVSDRPSAQNGKKDAAKPRGQVWLMAESGEPWQLTNALLGASNPAWSPDGATIAYRTKTRTEGDTVRPEDKSPVEKNAPRVLDEVTYRFDTEGQWDDTRFHIWVQPVDPAAGPARQVTSGAWNDTEPAWTADNSGIVFTSLRDPARPTPLQRDLWIVGIADGSTHRLSPGDGPASLPAPSPDGARIAYAGHRKGENGAVNTLVWTIPTGGGEPTALTEALDRGVLGVPPAGAMLDWSPDGASIYVLIMDGGGSKLCRMPSNGGAIESLTGTDRFITAFSLAPDGKTAAIVAASGDSPTELHLLPLDGGGQTRQLTAHNAPLTDDVYLGAYEPVQFAGADGWQMQAWLLRPFGHQEGQRYPLVLDIHGGPHGMHGQNFQPGVQELAGRGYGVLLVNPRGSSGYGEAFTAACVTDWGGKDYEDLMLGVDWAVQHAGADPERVFVTGYSYGGFMTSWVVGHTDRFKGAVCGAPVAEFVSFFGESDIGTTFGVFEQGGPPWERWQEYREHSPATHIVNCHTPFLLLHWEGDLRCPISQSELLFASLKKLGRETQFVRYPGGFHTYVTHAPSQRVDAVRRTGDWFDRHGGVACAAAAD